MKQWMITHSCHGLFGFGISSVTSFYPQKCTVQRRPCQRFAAWENCTKLAAWQLKDSFSVSVATLSLGISLRFLQFYPQCLDTSRLVWPYGMAAYECCRLISSIEGTYQRLKFCGWFKRRKNQSKNSWDSNNSSLRALNFLDSFDLTSVVPTGRHKIPKSLWPQILKLVFQLLQFAHLFCPLPVTPIKKLTLHKQSDKDCEG